MSAPAITASAESLFTEGHTAYRFTNEPVSDEQLTQIYELAKYTPTAMNSQPLRLTFIRTDAAKQRLLPLLSEANRGKAASAPVVAILAADTEFHEHLPRLNPQRAEARDHLAGDPVGRETMAKSNAWLQAGAFILAIRAAGLDAGPMAGIDAAGIDNEFFADSSLRTILVMNIGHAAPDGTFPRNPRLGFDQAVTVI